MKIAEVHVTYPDLVSSNDLAERLIHAHLAACVNVVPIQSIYEWKDKINTEKECLVIIKTSVAKKAGLILELKATHPYELPAITYSEVSVTTEYGAWVVKCVNKQ